MLRNSMNKNIWTNKYYDGPKRFSTYQTKQAKCSDKQFNRSTIFKTERDYEGNNNN